MIVNDQTTQNKGVLYELKNRRLIQEFIRIIIFTLSLVLLSDILYTIIKQNQQQITKYSGIQNVNRRMKGLFPPIVGQQYQIYKTWNYQHYRGFKSKSQISDYSKFSITFNENFSLWIKKTDCIGELELQWKAYSHNLYISEMKKVQQKDTNTTNESQQTKKFPSGTSEACISQGSFAKMVTNIVTWSIIDEQLFLLIQNQENKFEMFVMKEKIKSIKTVLVNNQTANSDIPL